MQFWTFPLFAVPLVWGGRRYNWVKDCSTAILLAILRLATQGQPTAKTPVPVSIAKRDGHETKRTNDLTSTHTKNKERRQNSQCILLQRVGSTWVVTAGVDHWAQQLQASLPHSQKNGVSAFSRRHGNANATFPQVFTSDLSASQHQGLLSPSKSYLSLCFLLFTIFFFISQYWHGYILHNIHSGCLARITDDVNEDWGNLWAVGFRPPTNKSVFGATVEHHGRIRHLWTNLTCHRHACTFCKERRSPLPPNSHHQISSMHQGFFQRKGTLAKVPAPTIKGNLPVPTQRTWRVHKKLFWEENVPN